MTAPSEIDPLLAPLLAAQQLLDRFDNQGMIIGGVAASLLGTPRLTADVDVVLLLSTSRLPELLSAASEVGLIPRIPDVEKFARQQSIVLLRHAASGISVDAILGFLPFEEEAVQRSTLQQVGSVRLRLPSPEDLIVLKAVAHRPKDLLDIQGIVRRHSELDISYIERWVRAFADALELPALWDDIAGMLPR
jgi:hypothetical protein